jgi:hypothetical protein
MEILDHLLERLPVRRRAASEKLTLKCLPGPQYKTGKTRSPR